MTKSTIHGRAERGSVPLWIAGVAEVENVCKILLYSEVGTMSGQEQKMFTSPSFAQRQSVEQVEEDSDLAPKFDAHGLIPVVTTNFVRGEVLMHACMNAD